MEIITKLFAPIGALFTAIDMFFSNIASFIVVNIFKVDLSTHLGGSIHFFFYDTLKIIFILSFMIFTISYIRSFFPPERVKEVLNKLGGIGGYFVAAVLGVLSPFCSCSTVPIFIGFVESGIPLGVTFTFLLTSPIVNEIAIGYLWFTYGFKVMAIYTVSGMAIGIISGMIIEKLNLVHLVEPYVFELHSGQVDAEVMTGKDRFKYAFDAVVAIVKRVWIFVVIGISIGAVIHGYAPEDLMVKYAGPGNPFAVFAAVAFGIPMYSNAVGIFPVVEALISKGVGVGTALAFMMSVVALSLPEMILLKQVIKPKLIGIFVGVAGVAILFTGYLFNIIL